MPKIVIDLDDTITHADSSTSYSEVLPNKAVIEKLREYKAKGFEVSIHTARNMRTHEGNIGKINALTLPIILEWLAKHEVPYDEVFVGKPWCGKGGFYVDDKSIRPDEFTGLSYEEITKIIGSEAWQ